jgi:hypothetical protein
MRSRLLIFLPVLLSMKLFAQDSIQRWQPFFAGVIFNNVPVQNISGTDTGYINGFSVAPFFSVRNRAGLGIFYSPRIVTSGGKTGIYLHELSAGIEQYDKKIWDYEFKYSHYFMTGNTNVPYTPLTNEIYGMLAYKKLWIRPVVAVGVGLGADTSNGISSPAHDYGLTVGISHNFEWDGDAVDFSLTPKIMINAGTNQYFSFLYITKYISHSKQFVNYVKTSPGHGSSGTRPGRGRGGSGGTTGSSTGTTSTTIYTRATETFQMSNYELGIESEIEAGSIAIRPNASLYIPSDNVSGSNPFVYWQVLVQYRF